MTRESFDHELVGIQKHLLELGGLVEQSILKSVEALKNKDQDEARRLIAADSEINRRRYEIETETLVMIARRQPMAIDLRTLAAVLEIASELERIADYAKGIAKLAIDLKEKPFIKPLIDIPEMAAKAAGMLHDSLASFTGRDVETAYAIAAEDGKVDDLYRQVYRDIIACVIADPGNIEGASHLTWVAHNLERAADRVVNICERIIFTVTGELIELDQGPPKPQ